MAKTYWWVSVGGNECEPAVVIGEPGAREAFTIGCADAFKLDEPKCPVVLVEEMEDAPLTPEAAKAKRAQDEKNWAEYRRQNPHARHGYRRFE